MDREDAHAARTSGTAPALHSQEEIRQRISHALTHLADGSALLERCRQFGVHPGDVRMLWLSARVVGANAVLGMRAAKLLKEPRRKAKRKRLQPVDGELNSHSSNFCTLGPR
jgi:hypothetical protein